MSHLWIFRVFLSITSPQQVPACGYGKGVWNNLQKRYNSLLRDILGAKHDTINLGIVVRGGWFPLYYDLALRAFTMYFKIHSKLVGPAILHQYSEFQVDDEMWDNSVFYAGAERGISFFENYRKPDSPSFLDLGTVPCFKRALKAAMYTQLTDC